MQITDAARWPAPAWPAWRLDESERAVAREPESSFHHLLGRVRLLAAGGDLGAAQHVLEALKQLARERRLPPGDMRQLIPVAVMIHDAAGACELLNLVAPTTHALAFAVIEQAGSDAVSLQIERHVATFKLNANLFVHNNCEILLQRLVDIYPILAFYLNSALCTPGTIAINLGDVGHVPGLAFCDGRPGYFLIPDAIYMDTFGYERVRRMCMEHYVPWEKRSPLAFWRGTTTGMVTDPKLGWRSLPRITLCQLAAAHADLMDVGLTNVVQIEDPGAASWIAEAGLLRPFVAPESFQQYKYQIDIDGNTTSWPGLFMKLLSRSVVLKVSPRAGLEQWYYDRLKPWVNFIPLHADMSDLPDKVRWLRQNDQAARSIGEAGYRLAEELTYQREITRAAPVVAAAVKDAVGAPVLELDFSVRGNGFNVLREGWHPAESDGVTAASFQSRIELPRPHGIGGFVLSLDLSPTCETPQRLTIVIDGESVEQRRIEARTTIHVPLSRRLLQHKEVVALSLLQPDARQVASPSAPGDTRMAGIRLHAITARTAWRLPPGADPDFEEATARLHALDNVGHGHDVFGSLMLPLNAALLSPIYTHHGTLAYADLAAGELRHGAPDVVPHNLFVVVTEAGASLIRIGAHGQQRVVALRPEGPRVAAANPAGLDHNGLARHFDALPDGGAFALAAAGLLLCAEPNRRITLSRTKAGIWETFRTKPEPGLTPA